MSRLIAIAMITLLALTLVIGCGQKAEETGDHYGEKGAEKEGRPEGGIEEGGPEVVVLHPGPWSEHEVDDAVDGKERQPGGTEIDPAYYQVVASREGLKGVVVNKDGDDLHQEKDPFRAPGKNKGMDQHRGGRRI